MDDTDRVDLAITGRSYAIEFHNSWILELSWHSRFPVGIDPTYQSFL